MEIDSVNVDSVADSILGVGCMGAVASLEQAIKKIPKNTTVTTIIWFIPRSPQLFPMFTTPLPSLNCRAPSASPAEASHQTDTPGLLVTLSEISSYCEDLLASLDPEPFCTTTSSMKPMAMHTKVSISSYLPPAVCNT